MIDKLEVRGFKSIERIQFEPGRVNVLIGSNGSGKSNLLEAIGVLSAAVHGRVDDEALSRRGVRLGVPALFKCSFPDVKGPLDIHFGAWRKSASYEVSLFNPIKEPSPVWRYHTENLQQGGQRIVGRSHRKKDKHNPEAGLAALKLVEMTDKDDALHLLNELREFAIFTPNTPTLRGNIADGQQRQPVGLSGGQLANAVMDIHRRRILKKGQTDEVVTFRNRVLQDALYLMDWAKSFGTAAAATMPLSPAVASSEKVIRFTDRFMKSGRQTLSGYEASEGALYVLFHMVLAAHPKSPPVCAVDNADHGLNPRVTRQLFSKICDWYLDSPYSRQIFLTTHNPLSLDGLPLQNDKVRLFTVSRTDSGRTVINRIELSEKLKKLAEQGWTLSRLWVMGHLGGVANV
ncbi:RecF/RecN/SMC N-terminal domain protein [delta proteobacterium NaphS2]|nr:RecF/RecN/SMC N-terminal domain protein [delta proteobacterium NaphS2]